MYDSGKISDLAGDIKVGFGLIGPTQRDVFLTSTRKGITDHIEEVHFDNSRWKDSPEPFPYELELAFMKGFTGQRAIEIPKINSGNSKEFKEGILYGAALGVFEISPQKLASYRLSDIQVNRGNKDSEINPLDIFVLCNSLLPNSFFTRFKSVVPDEGFPTLSLGNLEPAKGYFQRASNEYFSRIDERTKERLTARVLEEELGEHFGDTWGKFKQETKNAKIRHLAVWNYGRNIKQSDLGVGEELERWKDAA